MLIHESLENYFRVNFSLVKHHGFSLTELEMMQPWEREVYVILLNNYLEAQAEAAK